MKATPTFLLLLAFSSPLKAQNLQPEPPVSSEVQKAIDEFNRLKREGKELQKEVTVVLEPTTPEDEAEPEPDSTTLGETPTPADTPPEDTTSIVDLPELPPAPQPTSETKEPGLEIKIENITQGTGEIDPSQVQLKASFAPKPLSTPPTGWILEKSENAPPLVKEIELQPGTTITLRIQPHILSPQADGAEVFSVSEPGFRTTLGYRQTQTISAILGDSIATLDSDSLRLETAISDLHNLLASLPKPETPPAAKIAE